MGLCMCRSIMDDDASMAYHENLQRDLSVVKNRIQAKKLPIIWMDGQTGSGLNSHGLNIAARFDYTCIAMEQLLKEEENRTTPRGKLLKMRLESGKTVSDKIILDLIKEKMVEAGETRGYLVLGFPINPKQAQAFLKDVGVVDCIILLEGIPQQANAEFPVIDKPSGDRKIPESNRKHDMLKDLKFGSSKYDMLLEKINTNEPPADVFLRIEAAILDRLSPSTN